MSGTKFKKEGDRLYLVGEGGRLSWAASYKNGQLWKVNSYHALEVKEHLKLK